MQKKGAVVFFLDEFSLVLIKDALEYVLVDDQMTLDSDPWSNYYSACWDRNRHRAALIRQMFGFHKA